MIELYSGTPGSGKSLHTAYRIIDLLRLGKTVIANFPIDYDGFFSKEIQKGKKLGKFFYCDNQRLSVKLLKRFARRYHRIGREHQTLLVIDECAAMFNSRMWDMKGRQEWIYFFQQHRKLGYDVILVSQNDRLIDRQIRAFIETEYKHRAIKNYKNFGFLLSLVCGGLFASIEYWYGTKLKCGTQMFVLNRRKARIYDTYKLFE